MKIKKQMARMSHLLTTIWSVSLKTLPTYPPHPPMPASRHPAQALRIPADYQLPGHSGTAEN